MAIDMQEICQRAKAYVQSEQHDVFREQVESLLRRLDSSEPDLQAEQELYERFYKPLSFGTGGMRGEIGGGLNRLNCYTVRKATQGLAQYICKNVEQGKRHVCLAYDSRNYSETFAKEAALILTANGIKASIFTGLRPTPELSFAVRQLQCCAGIVITASHNPAKYNGCKVYWEDGSQVVSPHDQGIIAEVNAVEGELPNTAKPELLNWIDELVDKPYQDMIVEQALRPALFQDSRLKLVYTPLHGAGRYSVENVLQRLGVEVFTVPEQAEPNGDFPGTPFPNPEIAPAMELALQHAKQRKADLVLGTDPDSDRLGIAVPDNNGEYILISGNQLGAMLCDYIFRTRKEQGTLPPNAAFINTIVTSNLQNRIAQSYGVTDCKVLTGFKFIGAKMREWEQTGQYQYVFGCEESYGYLVGTQVRDKDAVSASTMVVEMALWNLKQGRSLLQYLNDIYQRFGYYQEALIDRYFEGSEGSNIMENMMNDLRCNSPKSIAGIRIDSVKDYLNRTSKTFTGSTEQVKQDIDLPKSNVLQFNAEDGSIILARPSGTEPKIKFYALCTSKNSDLVAAQHQTQAKIDAVEKFVLEQIAKAQNA